MFRTIKEMNEYKTKLCAAVKIHECLYDRFNPNYFKKPVRDKAWQMVANQCCEAVLTCKSRWMILQNEFAQLILSTSEQNPIKSDPTKYYLYDHLSFLIPHIYMFELETKSSNTYDDPLFISDLEISNDSNNKKMGDDDIPARVTRSSMRLLENNKVESVKPDLKRRRATIDVRPSKFKATISSNLNKEIPTKIQKEKISKKNINPDTTNDSLTIEKEIQCNLEDDHSNDLKFFRSLIPHMNLMNARQKMLFKKNIYQSLVDVFDCPENFPTDKDVNTMKKKLQPKALADSVSVGEIRLIRELVALVQSAKQTPELMSDTQDLSQISHTSNIENNINVVAGNSANVNKPENQTGCKVVYVKRIERDEITKLSTESSESSAQKKPTTTPTVSIPVPAGLITNFKNLQNKNMQPVKEQQKTAQKIPTHHFISQARNVIENLNQVTPDTTVPTVNLAQTTVKKTIRTPNLPTTDTSKISFINNSPTVNVLTSQMNARKQTSATTSQINKPNGQKLFIPTYGIEKKNYQHVVEKIKTAATINSMVSPITASNKQFQRGTILISPQHSQSIVKPSSSNHNPSSFNPKPSNPVQGQNTAVTIASDDFYMNDMKKEYDF